MVLGQKPQRVRRTKMRVRLVIDSGLLWILGTVVLANAQLVVRLDMVPRADMVCTGDRVELHCHHNATHSQPDWRITGVTGQILRTVDFQGNTQLAHHKLINDTNTEEVLEISNILADFDGLTYMCFYDIFEGEVQSNTVKLKVHSVPPVRNVTPTSVSLTSVTLSWTQDSDTQCNSQPSLVHIVINRDDTKRLRSDISINVTEGQTLFQYNLRNLDPGVLYSVSIHVSTDDGRRSAATSIEFETRTLYLQQYNRNFTLPNTQGSLYCGTNCTLYVVSALLFVVSIGMGSFLVAFCTRKLCKKIKRKYPVNPDRTGSDQSTAENTTRL